MRHLFVIIYFFVGFSVSAQSPGKCKVILKLVDQYNYPLAYSDFWLVENVSKNQTNEKTNKYGNAILSLDANKSYTFNCKGAPDYLQIEIDDRTKFLERTIVVITSEKISSPPDTIVLRNPPGRAALENEAMVSQTWIDKSKIRIRNMPVSLYNRATNKVYVSLSDEYGTTRFLVPEGKYFMSVGLLHNYKEIEVKKSKDMVITDLTTFIRTNIKEKMVNDTIIQNLDPSQEGTSESGLFIFKLRDFEKKPLSGELVWVNVVETGKVYQSVTDSYGMAKFLLPKGLKFDVSLKYARSIELFGFPVENTNHVHQVGFSYLGSVAIEKFYDEVKRTEEGFQTEFKSIPIEALSNPIHVAEIKSYGFNLNFRKNEPCSPPVISDDHIFISGGYHSRQFYSFNTKTGKFVWGVELAESGASPTVYLDGVILVNTQSCTLYALEASSGKLLWSKWLGPNIYTTPTAANGMVFAVYPRSIQRRDLISFGLNPFVVVAFDLKSGNILWQKGIDSDVIAAPVANAGNLYLTTTKGSLYRFNSKSGNLLGMAKILAVNQPTIIGDRILVSSLSFENQDHLSICVLDTANLNVIKKLPSLTGVYRSEHFGSASQRMGFIDGRTVNKQGKNFNLIDGILICSDAKSNQIIWSKKAGNHVVKSFYSVPTVLKNHLLVSTSNGKVLVYEPQNGNLVKTFSTGNSFWSSPIVHNGWIYVTTIDGKLVSINTKDPQNYTGWPQWCMDASFNLIVK